MTDDDETSGINTTRSSDKVEHPEFAENNNLLWKINKN